MINTTSNIKMQTVNLAITNEVISYKYKFSRLLEIQYPHHPENNVSYIYIRRKNIAIICVNNRKSTMLSSC